MTIADDQAEGGGHALAREAAHWFARMRSPDAEDRRADFEIWLAQGPKHLAAYNRASEIFAMGKLLAEPHLPLPAAPAARRRKAPAIALAAVATCAIGLALWATLYRSGLSDRHEDVAGTTDHRRLSTIAGETRVVRLADGSTVRLGDGTILDVDIGGGRRGLRLSRGQGRFEVAHEQRPFVVQAGGGSVTARGTIFEVALTPAGKVDVRLLQGAVDVALPYERAAPKPRIRKLVAGEGVSFRVQPNAAGTSPTTTGLTPAPSAGARDFEARPVAELVALANRGAARPIRLGDASLAGRRVSGRFRIDEPELLARRLGTLFGREVDTSRPGEIILAGATAEGVLDPVGTDSRGRSATARRGSF